MNSECFTNPETGDKIWVDPLTFKLDREDDLPTVERKNGTLEWISGGVLHRNDGPARITADGTLEYHLYGKLGRYNDEPAVIKADGTIEYYLNGCRNRLNGPAVIRADGSTEYWEMNHKHRVGGPAVHRPSDGSNEYWYNGEQYLPDTPFVTSEYLGSRKYRTYLLNGNFHRVDGPAWRGHYWITGTKFNTEEEYKLALKLYAGALPDGSKERKKAEKYLGV